MNISSSIKKKQQQIRILPGLFNYSHKRIHILDANKILYSDFITWWDKLDLSKKIELPLVVSKLPPYTNLSLLHLHLYRIYPITIGDNSFSIKFNKEYWCISYAENLFKMQKDEQVYFLSLTSTEEVCININKFLICIHKNNLITNSVRNISENITSQYISSLESVATFLPIELKRLLGRNLNSIVIEYLGFDIIQHTHFLLTALINILHLQCKIYSEFPNNITIIFIPGKFYYNAKGESYPKELPASGKFVLTIVEDKFQRELTYSYSNRCTKKIEVISIITIQKYVLQIIEEIINGYNLC
jgi:hypothetical protein